MLTVAVRCSGSTAGGWTCDVRVREADRDRSSHVVRVSPSDLTRLTPGAADPTALVERSFAFLLERERPEAILRSFDLLDIGRYFPEYEAEIRQRLTG